MRGCVAIVLSLVVATVATAQEQFIYPSKGQSAQQQEKDKFECYGWATRQSHFDPMAPPTTSTPPPSRGGRSVAGGALAGGEAGKGAAIGAATGGLHGGVNAAGANAAASQNYREWERREATSYAA